MVRIWLWLILLLLAFAQPGYSKSAFSPRHSGIEPPDAPRPMEGLPGNSPSRTAEGGMGYTDAYGNTVRRDEDIEEKKHRKRLIPGAYGNNQATVRPLPDSVDNGPPLWKYK